MEISKARLEKLIQMLEQQPSDLFLKYALAMEYLSLSDLTMAEQFFKEVIAGDEHYVPAYYQLGKIYEGRSEDQKAIKLFEKGLAEATLKHDHKTIREFKAALDELLF